MRCIIIFLLIFLPASAVSGPVAAKITGRVVGESSGEPIAGAVIRAGRSFTSSDESGEFILAVSSPRDSVAFKCMGYETLTLPPTADFSAVRLREKETVLHDVIVEAPDIYARGDTLVFNVGRYAKPEDNAIIDVIKRLPGIKVDDDGTILYQGKPINKFYLDGNDFIGGQYGLATDNISHKDVASVEVMENHQPVKALEGIEFPEEAGINLRLKEDARVRPVGVAQGGAGVEPFIYDASLFAMSLARKVQAMMTFKIDNTGWNPATQIMEHDFNDMFSNQYAETIWPAYITADAAGAPLSEKRTRDNLSWLANSITAWKSGDTSMRLKLNYVGDRLDFKSGLTTDYIASDIPAFIEDNDMRTRTHDVSAQFNAEINRRGYFLKDRLTFDASWDRSKSLITGSYDVAQRVRRNSLSAVNDLKLVKRNDRKVFTLTSRNSFSHAPDRLFVSGPENAAQTVSATEFRSTTETKYGKFTRFWKYYAEGGLDIDYRRSDFSLAGINLFDNQEKYNSFRSIVYAVPQADYERGRWRLSFDMPLRWEHLSLRGNRDFINVLPGMYARRQMTSKSDLTFSAGYSLLSSRPYLFMDNPVLQDFRNVFIPDGNNGYTHNFSFTGSYRYRNPLNALFFNISASCNISRNPLTTDVVFIDDFVVTTFARHFSWSRTGGIKGEVSKGVAHSRIVLGCDAAASATSASALRNGNAESCKSFNASLKPYFKGSITRWLSMNYEGTYGFSSLNIENTDKKSHTFHQNLALTAYPHDRVQLTVGAEHYLTRFPEGNKSGIVLLDASAAWQIDSRLRLSLKADNLLGNRDYRYITYGTLSSTEHRFRIRPRNISASLQYRF